jgi:DNA repair protein SbcD/Mre11
MGKESFRFIHASDFHLDRPLLDLPDLPDHLRAAIVDAPWKAAEAIFENAILENVDFVVLAGDLLNPVSSGAWGPAFLLEQFDALNKKNIPIYWAMGEADGQNRWPEAIALPANVHRFSDRKSEPLTYRRAGLPLATIIGRSYDGRQTINAAEYHFDDDELFRIAVAYGQADGDSLSGERIDYWALGGNHARKSLGGEHRHVYYCGTPQARGINEQGSHGFHVCEVDSNDAVRVHTMDCDVLRYSEQIIDADDMAVVSDLRTMLAKRVQKLQSQASGRHTLVDWKVQMDLENASVVGPAAIEELLVWLRREFGHGTPAVWSTDIEVLPPKAFPKKWMDEDTILGDFLRTAMEARKDAANAFTLTPIIESETPGGLVWQSTLGQESSSVHRKSELDLATLLGVDMLRGHNVDLLSCTRRFGYVESRE